MKINILLFHDFTALDVFGPVEVLCRIPDARISFRSIRGGIVCNHQGLRVDTEMVTDESLDQVWLIPGGFGTRTGVNDRELTDLIKTIAERSEYCLTVCTGSALLAKTGALDGRRAATNHRAFGWASSQSDAVSWDPVSRWVKDGKFYTSAGVSAGIDMALAFVSDVVSPEYAAECADAIEYERRD
ncbi:MAG: DJ-1/PfpI family protein [Firmicutes bacterium]|nr:DJ-1/PfpI family protein [Bacillota bacterium]